MSPKPPGSRACRTAAGRDGGDAPNCTGRVHSKTLTLDHGLRRGSSRSRRRAGAARRCTRGPRTARLARRGPAVDSPVAAGGTVPRRSPSPGSPSERDPRQRASSQAREAPRRGRRAGSSRRARRSSARSGRRSGSRSPGPRPIVLTTTSGSPTKPRKTAVMIAPAARMIRPTRASARITDCSGVAPVEVLLADPRLQEDVVVHAQAEQDREHEERDEATTIGDVHAGLEDQRRRRRRRRRSRAG